MDIHESKLDRVTVARMSGRLDVATAPAAQARLLEMLASGSALIADMTDVAYVSSAGLRVLLMAAKQAKSRGAHFGLIGPQPSVREVLAMSGFDKIIQVHPDLDTAIGTLG